MEKQGVPIEFSWVEERNKCRLPNVFKEIENEVKEDVRVLSNLFPHGAEAFTIIPGRNRFSVNVLSRNSPVPDIIIGSVEFALTGESIHVSSDDKSIDLTAEITLNDEGRCKLKIGNEELEHWQFRKRALEKLFYGPR